MVLLVLAVLWGIVLIPPAVRNRREARQGRSVENARKRLEVVAPPAVPRACRPPSAVRPVGSALPRVAVIAEPRPLPVSAPPKRRPSTPPKRRPATPAAAGRRPSRSQLLRRRRQVFGFLCGAAVLSLGLALAPTGLRPVLGAVHLLVDAALAAYVAGLRRLRVLARERVDKVRYLPLAATTPVATPDAGKAAEAPAARSAAL